MSVELALLTVPLVVLMIFVVALGRFSSARNQVNEAARDAAREASIYYQSDTEAIGRGTDLANRELTGIECSRRNINVSTANLHPGGTVVVSVTCHVPLDDLVLLAVPGSRAISATSTAVVDTYVTP